MGWIEAECFILKCSENDDFKTNLRSSLQLAMLLFFDKLGEYWTIEAERACEHGWGSAARTNDT